MQKRQNGNGGSSPGPAIDRAGAPVIDPTENVIALVEAGMARQDDLREADSKHGADMRAVLREYEEKLRLASEKLSDVRADYENKLRRAESSRIDAIRAVDVAAVGQAAQVSATQATTLAAQVTASAETLRNTVAASATAAANALSQALQPIQKSIDDLRQAQYQQQGQQTQKTEGQDSGRFIIATIVSVAGLLMTITLAIGAYFISHPGAGH